MQPIHHASIVYTLAIGLAIPAGYLVVQPVQLGLEMRPAIRPSEFHKGTSTLVFMSKSLWQNQ
jgi:hypothetical protein